MGEKEKKEKKKKKMCCLIHFVSSRLFTVSV
jgi:hypothetical protein